LSLAAKRISLLVSLAVTARRKIGAGLGLAFVILAAARWGSYTTTSELIEITHRIRHTYRVRERLQSVLSLLKDAETGARGYALSGRTAYLRPYRAAINRIDRSVGDLQLILDAPEQREQLDTLQRLIARRLEALRHVIDVRDTQGLMAAAAAVEGGPGRALMEQIRSAVTALRNAETVRLKQQEEAARINTTRTLHALSLGAVLSYAILLVIFYFLDREILQRARAQGQLADLEQQQAVVADLGQSALSGIGLTALMERAVAAVRRTLDVEYCKLLEWTPDGRALQVRAGSGWQNGAADCMTIAAGSASQAGYALLSNAPVIVEDLQAETRFRVSPPLHAQGVVSGASIVIPGQHRAFGVLDAHATQRRAFSPDDVHFLQAVANVVAVAIEQRQAEEALRRSEEQFRSLIENSSDLITLLDSAGTIRYASPSHYTVLGYATNDLVGRAVADFVHPDDLGPLLEAGAARRPPAGTPPSVEVRVRHADGSWRVLEARSSTWPYEPVVAGIVVNSRDVTARKRAEEDARQRRAELAHVLRVSTVGELAAGLAHEINQPLSAIIAYAKGCARRMRAASGRPAELLEAMEEIATQAGRADRIVRRLRDFVRKREPRREAVVLNDLVRAVTSLVASEAHEQGIALRLRLAPDLPVLWVDSVQIEQVIVNLVRNGIDAMRALDGETEPVLSICTSRAGEDSVELAVSDVGEGLHDVDPDQMFDPFFTTKPGSLGMGLSISRSIIEAHDGQLWATCNPERGATFHFSVPVAARRGAQNA
jgi:two-component system, LuxR family, sensor kinase FixL